MASKPGFLCCPGTNLAETCLLARWRELDPGFHVELREPVAAMLREKHKQKPCKADSIDALHRGGQARSSVEAAVMAVERRGLVIQLQSFGQLPRRRSR